MKHNPVRFVFALLIIVMYVPSSALAQSPGSNQTCEVTINAVDAGSGERLVEFGSHAWNRKSAEKVGSQLHEGGRIFNSLAPGIYRFQLSKEGFSMTYFDLEIAFDKEVGTCKRFLEIPVWKGSGSDHARVVFSEHSGKFELDESSLSDSGDGALFKLGDEDLTPIVNGTAIELPKPRYPDAARLVKAKGEVQVKILIGMDGMVLEAEAVSGPELLRQASVDAALRARFKPTLIEGKPVEVEGIIVYNFF